MPTEKTTLCIYLVALQKLSSTVRSVGFFSDSRLSSRGFESRQCDTHLVSASLQAPENWTVVLHDSLRRATATCLAAQQSDSPNLASPQAPKNGLSCRRAIAQIWRHSKRPKMDCRTSRATAQIWRQSKRPKMDRWKVRLELRNKATHSVALLPPGPRPRSRGLGRSGGRQPPPELV